MVLSSVQVFNHTPNNAQNRHGKLLNSQKPARPDQIKWFDTFSANRIRLINSQMCLND